MRSLALELRRVECRRSGDEAAAAVFVDMDADDLVERALGLESELARAAGLDALRPAVDDARDQRIVDPAEAPFDSLAGDAAQRRHLLRPRAADLPPWKIDQPPATPAS